MNDFSRNSWAGFSDSLLLQKVGEFIQHHRLNQNKSQTQVAEVAGISRSTLSLMERGENTSFISIIQVLRVLDLLHLFQAFEIEKIQSPVLYAKLQQEARQRASKNSDNNDFMVREDLEW